MNCPFCDSKAIDKYEEKDKHCKDCGALYNEDKVKENLKLGIVYKKKRF